MKKRLNVIGHNVLIKKLNPVYEGNIIFPDSFKQKLIYGIVISRGEKVNSSIQNESIVTISWTCEKVILGREYCDNEELIIVKDYDILLIKDKRVFRPFGKNVIISRLNEDVKLNSGIIVHSLTNEKIQTLYGVIKTLGTFNSQIIECNANIGDTVKIKKWSEKIKELEWFNDYCLIVPTELLELKINDPSDTIPI
jgi:co-chaperonin GroES (HSP10)